MATNNVVDYNDERLAEVESAKDEALNENETLYSGMAEQTDQFYTEQINASKDWAEEQKKNQQDQTDFTIEQIEQQKDQANKDYTKEQSGSYVDWQKESNRYGANAEQMAASGLSNTGYSESSQVSLYNTYQNRVASARESYSQAVLNYNNAIKDAQLQNNSILAEIAYTSLQQQLELSLQGFQYKNQLLLDAANTQREIESMYHSQYQDVLSQINTENSMAEQIRQYNENLALQQQKLEEEQRQYNENLQLQLKQLEEEKRQYEASLALEKEKLAEEQRQYNTTNSVISGSGSINKDTSSGSSETPIQTTSTGRGYYTDTGNTLSMPDGSTKIIYQSLDGDYFYNDGKGFVKIVLPEGWGETWGDKGNSENSGLGTVGGGVNTSVDLWGNTRKNSGLV